MEARPPTIVIVDDAAEVRLLVKTRLRLAGGMTVVGEGSDGTEAVALARKHRPSLLLLDVSMPVMDGFEALPQVLQASPDTRVVLYSGFEEEGLAERARELGAAAFLEKSSSIDAVVEDLLAILNPLAETEPGPTSSSASLLDVRPVTTTRDQKVLDEHLERFREVFEEAAIGMATMTLNGRLVRVNRALARLLDRPSKSLVGASYGDLTEGDDGALLTALEDINQRGQDVVQVEHDVTWPSERRRVVATLSPVRDSSGRPLYVFLQVQDVTATRAAEAELKVSESRFRLLVEAVEDYAIFMLSPEGHIVSWNAGAERINGYRAEEILGQHFRVFYPPEVQESRHPEHELQLAIRDGHYEEAGWRVRKDGSRFWANVLITTVYDGSGRHVGFAKVTRDITERREAEERLRESEERFRMLLESVHDYAIYMLDTEGRIASWNLGAERSKGYTAEEILGQHFRVFYPPERQAEQHPEHELEIARREGHYEEEGWRVRKDGSRFWANVVITTVYDERGRHVGFAKVTRDITERRRMAEERELAAEALAAANDELEVVNDRLRQVADDQSQFLAVTAHELRTPVGVLGGSAEMLDKHWRELTDEERVDILQGMTTSAGRLRRLLGDLLTASRLERRVLELHPSTVSVASVVHDAVAAVRRAQPDVQVTVGGTPEVDVVADADRLAQSLDNLIGNALRHGASPVHVDVRPRAAVVEIRVSDLGPGVAEEMQPRLFERFATGDSKGGTGLGLFIVRELARAQGGDASYEPGTQDQPAGAFVLSLPRSPEDL